MISCGDRGIGEGRLLGRGAIGYRLLLKRFQFTRKRHPLCIQSS